MILKRITTGPLSTNGYIFGSSKKKKIILIDPAFEINRIKQEINNFDAQPIAVLLTHTHFDHVKNVRKLLKIYDVPLMYNKKELEFGSYSIEADKWISEGDEIKIGELNLRVMETPGHTPGSTCYYCKEINKLVGIKADGLIFTGDLIFRRSIGRPDMPGGDQRALFASIKNKIIYNPKFSNHTILLPGHMGMTTIGEERQKNIFRQYFL